MSRFLSEARCGEARSSTSPAVQLAGLRQDRTSESLDYGVVCRLTRHHDLPGQLVSVDDGHTEAREKVSDGSLAAADSAGYSDD